MLSLPYQAAASPRVPRRAMQPSRLSLKSLWRLYQQAQSLLKSGQIRDAADSFHRIALARARRPSGSASRGLPEDPNPLAARAPVGRGHCCVKQGRLEEALREVRTALEAEPTNSEALCELAYIYSLRGMRDQALGALTTAIEH